MSGLETQKCLLQEQLDQAAQPARTFEEALEHAMAFLSNPWKPSERGGFDLRRAILKFLRLEPLHYHRETGARTPNIAFPFKALEEFSLEI